MRRLLAAILLLLGIALAAVPCGRLLDAASRLLPANASCAHCYAPIRVPAAGQILHAGCKHLQDAGQARQRYTWPADLPRLDYSVQHDGPVPPGVTVIP